MMDICSIFGNAIDNAIECVEKIADQNMREKEWKKDWMLSFGTLKSVILFLDGLWIIVR